MGSLKYLYNVHGQYIFTMGNLDNVRGHSGQSPVSPLTKLSETSQTGRWPCSQWILYMDSVDIVYGFSVQSDSVHEQLDKVQYVQAD